MQLIILASGRGSRLKSKTKNTPKTLVKVNRKPILDYMLNKFKLFKQVLIVGGYKIEKLKQYENNIVKIVDNRNYINTNMVYSLFKAKNYIKSDVIICYSDIIFSKKIFINMIKKKSSHLPLNKNWLKNWKERMRLDQIKNDAEDLVINKKNIVNIGGKIKKRLPKYQYMGIIRLRKNDYKKLYQYFKKINNEKVDMTTFLCKAIKEKIIKLQFIVTGSFWTEIDSPADIKAAEKMLKKNV